jgi:hypothetical protein
VSKLVPRTSWDPGLGERLPASWPLGPALADLAACEAWPSVARIGELLARFEVRNARGDALRVEEQAPKPRHRRRAHALRCRDALYDARIDGEGVLPTRARSYHDLFNALVWASFPRSKAAISARQHAIWARTLPSHFTTLPSARTREQDALAMLDEGGLLLAARPDACAEAAALVAAGAVGELERRAEEGVLVGLVLGHAVHEHFVSSEEPVRAACFVLPVDPVAPELVARVDAALARRVDDPACFAAPPEHPGLLLRARSPLCVRPAVLLRGGPPVLTTDR